MVSNDQIIQATQLVDHMRMAVLITTHQNHIAKRCHICSIRNQSVH